VKKDRDNIKNIEIVEEIIDTDEKIDSGKKL